MTVREVYIEDEAVNLGAVLFIYDNRENYRIVGEALIVGQYLDIPMKILNLVIEKYDVCDDGDSVCILLDEGYELVPVVEAVDE